MKTTLKQPVEDYIPFGPEWEQYMMKLPKKYLINMIRKNKEDSIAFAKWLSSQGWQQYDEADRWICPSCSRTVYTTEKLYEFFEKDKK